MAITLSTAAQDAAVNSAADAVVDLLDGGTGAGHIRLTLADGTTEVATCVGQDPFFNDAGSDGTPGEAPQNGNAVDSNATGNASAVTLFQARDGDDTEVWNGTVGESGEDLNIDDGTVDGDVIIDAGAVVTLSSIVFAVTIA